MVATSSFTEKESGSMVRDSKPVAFLLSVLVAVILVGRDCFRTVWSTSKGSESRRGVAARVLGWAPTKLDGSRETAWLDGLRGVAAGLVMMYHFHLSWLGPQVEAPYGAYLVWKWHFWRLPIIRLFFCSGHAQVCVFFVLSGFVLSWSTLGSIRSGRLDKISASLGSSAFRRWFRLYLPCFIAGFFGMILWRVGAIGLVATKRDSAFGQVADWFVESLRWSNPFHLERSGAQTLYAYNWTMWTIPDEFAGSMLTFVVCLAVSRFRSYWKRTLFVLSLAIWACVQAMWTYWLFASGILIADYVREAGGFQKLSERTSFIGRVWWTIVLIIGLLLAGIPENNDMYPKPGYNWLYDLPPTNWLWIEGGVRWYWSWAGIFILAASCHLAIMRRIFELSFIRYLGRISFMLYITHRTVEETIVYHIRQFIFHRIGKKEFNEKFQIEVYVVSPVWDFPLFLMSWLVAGPLALIVAHWCDVLIDAPCTRFAKWLDDRFTNGFIPEPKIESQEEEIGLLPV